MSCYIDYAMRIHYDHTFPLWKDDPLLRHLEFLYVHFTLDSYLKSCILYMIPLSKDHDFRGILVNDVKLKYNIEVWVR